MNGQKVVVEYEDEAGNKQAKELDPMEVNVSLTPYDVFLINTYHRCYNQFAVDAGIVSDLLPELGNEIQQADMMDNLNKIHKTLMQAQEAQRAYKQSCS